MRWGQALKNLVVGFRSEVFDEDIKNNLIELRCCRHTVENYSWIIELRDVCIDGAAQIWRGSSRTILTRCQFQRA
jgi:hypothetical protein